MGDISKGVETSQRLMSLDALKGFDMFWILLPTYPVFHQLLVALGLGGCWLDRQMTHLPWNGFTFYDTIYPLFLFMAGVSFSYSCASARRRGATDARVALGLLRRVVVLVLVGSTIHGSLQLDPRTFTLCSVIGRIGISCGLAGCIWILSGAAGRRIAVCVAMLAIYGALPFFVAAPGAPDGAAPYGSAQACIYAWMDGNVFPMPLFKQGFAGLFSMTVTALSGMLAGDWMRRRDIGDMRRIKGLVLAAAVQFAVGLLVAHGFGPWSVPINKPIWSSSYVLVTGGYSCAMLALFFWLIDVKGWQKWCFPLRVIGMNLLFAYVASRTILPFRGEMSFLFGGVMRLMPSEAWGEFAGQLGCIVVYWLLLYALYRRKWFFKA